MLDAWLHQQAVDDHFDGVILALVERNVVFQIQQLPIYASARESVLDEFFYLLLKLAFSPANNRGEHHDAVFRSQGHHPLHDLLGGLAGDGASATGTMRKPNRCEEKTKVVVNFGDGANGRARAAAGGLLLDGNGRAEAVDGVNVGA